MRSIVAGIGFFSALAVVAMLQFTTPQSVGPFGVLAFFVFIYTLCASIVYLGMSTVLNLLKRLLPHGQWQLRIEVLSATRQYYYASFLALIPTILIGIGSVGQIGAVELGLLTAFGLIGCFYISRRF